MKYSINNGKRIADHEGTLKDLLLEAWSWPWLDKISVMKNDGRRLLDYYVELDKVMIYSENCTKKDQAQVRGFCKEVPGGGIDVTYLF